MATSKGQGGREARRPERHRAGARHRAARGAVIPLDFASMMTDTVKQKAEDLLRGQLEKRLGGAALPAPAAPAAPAAGAKKEAPRAEAARGMRSRD
ncbi:MAG: hypothetical protein KIT18_05905 [Burkholderiales bacterium]|nr:hypothetical protein [Burkholderiales bacterium]